MQKQTDEENFQKKLDDCLAIAVSYLIKRKIEKIIFEVIFNINIFYFKFCLNEVANDQDFVKLIGE